MHPQGDSPPNTHPAPLVTVAKRVMGRKQEDNLQSRKEKSTYSRVSALVWRAVWEIYRYICLTFTSIESQEEGG